MRRLSLLILLSFVVFFLGKSYAAKEKSVAEIEHEKLSKKRNELMEQAVRMMKEINEEEIAKARADADEKRRASGLEPMNWQESKAEEMKKQQAEREAAEAAKKKQEAESLAAAAAAKEQKEAEEALKKKEEYEERRRARDKKRPVKDQDQSAQTDQQTPQIKPAVVEDPINPQKGREQAQKDTQFELEQQRLREEQKLKEQQQKLREQQSLEQEEQRKRDAEIREKQLLREQLIRDSQKKQQQALEQQAQTQSVLEKQKREQQLKDQQAALEKQKRDQILKDQQAALEKQKRDQILKDQQAALEKQKREQLLKDQQVALEKQREQLLKDQQLKEQQLKEQQAALEKQKLELQLKEQQLKEQQLKDQQAALEKQKREQILKEQQAALEKQKLEQQLKEQAALEKQKREQILKEQQAAVEKQKRDQQLKNEQQIKDQQLAREREIREKQRKLEEQKKDQYTTTTNNVPTITPYKVPHQRPVYNQPQTQYVGNALAPTAASTVVSGSNTAAGSAYGNVNNGASYAQSGAQASATYRPGAGQNVNPATGASSQGVPNTCVSAEENAVSIRDVEAFKKKFEDCVSELNHERVSSKGFRLNGQILGLIGAISAIIFLVGRYSIGPTELRPLSAETGGIEIKSVFQYDEHNEEITLVNTCSADIEMTACTVVTSEGHSYQFDDGYVMAKKTSVTIASGENAKAVKTPSGLQDYELYDSRKHNKLYWTSHSVWKPGQVAELRDSRGQKVSSKIVT